MYNEGDNPNVAGWLGGRSEIVSGKKCLTWYEHVTSLLVSVD